MLLAIGSPAVRGPFFSVHWRHMPPTRPLPAAEPYKTLEIGRAYLKLNIVRRTQLGRALAGAGSA